MTKKKQRHSVADPYFYNLDLQTIDNFELLTLKAHILLDAALRKLLAARLSTTEPDLPDLTFANVTELALAGLGRQDVREKLFLVNRLRNSLAHEAVPSNVASRIREVTRKTLPLTSWPSDPSEQRAAYRNALHFLVALVNGVAMGYLPQQAQEAEEQEILLRSSLGEFLADARKTQKPHNNQMQRAAPGKKGRRR